jgi:hypothetical protein
MNSANDSCVKSRVSALLNIPLTSAASQLGTAVNCMVPFSGIMGSTTRTTPSAGCSKVSQQWRSFPPNPSDHAAQDFRLSMFSNWCCSTDPTGCSGSTSGRLGRDSMNAQDSPPPAPLVRTSMPPGCPFRPVPGAYVTGTTSGLVVPASMSTTFFTSSKKLTCRLPS